MKSPKYLSMLVLVALVLAAAGCSTPHSVAKLQGKGERHDFHMGYEPVWEAVRVVTVMDDLHVVQEDKAAGFISARRIMGEDTFGDSVAIWVREISTNRTQVEVVSRIVGAPVPWAPDHQHELLHKVVKVLTF